VKDKMIRLPETRRQLADARRPTLDKSVRQPVRTRLKGIAPGLAALLPDKAR
jgi:hypothetical protein